MKPLSVLLTTADGAVISANAAAKEMLGSPETYRCSEVVRSRNIDGDRVCGKGCAESLCAGNQVDHGVVRVRGRAAHLVCTGAGDHRVITLTPAPDLDSISGTLSPREKEVLQLVARGFTTHRIARRLAISPSTARTHVEHIREKLGVRTRSQAVAKALALGQID